jgi:hypothetical protein
VVTYGGPSRVPRLWRACVALVALAALVAAACFAAAPAHGYVPLGPSHDPDPAASQAINYPSPAVLFNVGAPVGVRLVTPVPGIVTRWTVYTGDVSNGSSLQLRIIEPQGGNNFRMIASGPVETLQAGNGQAVQRTFAARVPIAPGQGIGFVKTHPSPGFLEVTMPLAVPAPSPWARGHITPPPPDGSSGMATIEDSPGPGSDLFFVLSAEVEPDADADGFGDETQDRCAGSAGTDRGCLPGALDPQVIREPPVVTVNTVIPASALATIDPASVKLASNRKTLSLSVACPAQQSARCAGAVTAKTASRVLLPAGTRRRAVLSLGRARFSVAQGASSTVRLRVPARTRRAIARLRSLRLTVTLTASGTVRPTVR